MLCLLLLPAAFAEALPFETALARAAQAPLAAVIEAQAQEATAAARVQASPRSNPSVQSELRPDERDITLVVPLDPAFPAQARAAELEAQAAEGQRIVAQATWAAAVAGTWLDARVAADIARVSAAAEAAARGLLEAAGRRSQAGEWSPATLALLQADAVGLLDRTLRAGTLERTALADLKAMLGDSTPWDAVGDWPRLAPPPELDPERLPRLIVADMQARAALGQAHAAQMARLPVLSVGGGVVRGGHEGAVASLNLELPLYAPRSVDLAQAQAALAEAQASAAALDAVALAQNAWIELDTARAVNEAWAAVDLASAQGELQARFAAGELSVAEYLDLRDRLLAAQVSSAEARWRQARAELAIWELAGRIPEVEAP